MNGDAFLAVENVLFTITMVCYLASMALFFVFAAAKKEKLAKLAGLLMLAGFLVHTAALVTRGIGAGRFPMTNQYEFATSFAWGICLVFLIFFYMYKFYALGVSAAPILFLVIGYAAMQSKEVRELMPALRSSWLAIHVSAAIVAYGAFGTACAVSLLYILQDRLRESWDKYIPPKEKLDLISYRAVALGFLFLTFVMISGAIWAERAWGRYWAWDPKETWSFITWLVYAAFLHLRVSKGWRGKKSAVFLVVGFVCVLFTYAGVNLFLPGLHSYA